jgi:hypothetical protein
LMGLTFRRFQLSVMFLKFTLTDVNVLKVERKPSSDQRAGGPRFLLFESN